jgi:lantibiotic biosynthesis protein
VSTASRQLALTVAERLLEPARILAAIPDTGDAALATGLAGTALLHARLASTDRMFELAAVRHWAAAAAHARRYRPGSAGIFHSHGGLAASLIIGSGYLPDPGTHQAAGRAARWLAARALDLARRYQERRRAGAPGTPWAVYDAITGLSGIGRALLAAVGAGYDECEPGLTAALDALTAMISAGCPARPGWWLPASGHPPAVTAHPSGAAATGMAHGIAGPLALLSAAHAAGRTVAGQEAAIRAAAAWLLHWRAGSSWPPYVTGDELDSSTATAAPGRRDAWCYGSPGIGRALSMAALALTDAQLAAAADAALADLTDRAAEDWDTDGPTLCHGYAGVLQSTAHLRPAIADRAASAVAAAFTPYQPFGFRHDRGRGAASDEPGLLTGAAGIALALADHGGLQAPAVPARWDSLLLLS